MGHLQGSKWSLEPKSSQKHKGEAQKCYLLDWEKEYLSVSLGELKPFTILRLQLHDNT